MSRTLEAWINDRFVGTLHETNGLWAFKYSKQWLAPRMLIRFARAFHWSKAATRWRHQSPGAVVLRQSAARGRPANPVGQFCPARCPRCLRTAGALRRTTAHYGAESAGSVTLLAQGTYQGPHVTHPLSDEALSRRIQQSSGAAASRSKAKRPCRVPRRSTGADGRSSAGGTCQRTSPHSVTSKAHSDSKAARKASRKAGDCGTPTEPNAVTATPGVQEFMTTAPAKFATSRTKISSCRCAMPSTLSWRWIIPIIVPTSTCARGQTTEWPSQKARFQMVASPKRP